MPSCFNSSAFFSNPGNCWEEHVGVNAPGKLNKITLLFLKKSAVVLFFHFPPIAHTISLSEVSPSLILKVTWGILNPSIRFF